MTRLICLLYCTIVGAGTGAYAAVSTKSKTKAPDKSIPCDDLKAQTVRVSQGRLTVLSFPVAPKEIIPGENNFDFHRIGNDLVIKPLRPGASTNILVYMAERRCAFDLRTVPSGADGILLVRDPLDKQFEVNFK